jgi:hypothetical protein
MHAIRRNLIRDCEQVDGRFCLLAPQYESNLMHVFFAAAALRDWDLTCISLKQLIQVYSPQATFIVSFLFTCRDLARGLVLCSTITSICRLLTHLFVSFHGGQYLNFFLSYRHVKCTHKYTFVYTNRREAWVIQVVSAWRLYMYISHTHTHAHTLPQTTMHARFFSCQSSESYKMNSYLTRALAELRPRWACVMRRCPYMPCFICSLALGVSSCM